MSEIVASAPTIHAMGRFALLAAGDAGIFTNPISWIQGMLTVFGVLGLLLAAVIKALAGPDEERHATAHKMAGACILGLIFAGVAPSLYDLMFSWTGK